MFSDWLKVEKLLESKSRKAESFIIKANNRMMNDLLDNAELTIGMKNILRIQISIVSLFG